MNIRKYIIVGTSYGTVIALMVIAHNCKPLLPSELTRIAQQNFDPFCYIRSYELEPPEMKLAQQVEGIMRNSRLMAVTASGTASSDVNPVLRDIWDGKES